MKYDALIIIDVQTALVEAHPYNEKTFIRNMKKLLSICRGQKIPVIYVQHNGGSGDELESGSAGWQIYKEIAPVEEEKIIEKQYNSAFRNTDLNEYLNHLRAKNIILCGMMTEYCIDASCKVAFEYEYQVTIPKGLTTTMDNDFASGEDLLRYYEESMWNNRYASVLPLDAVIAEIIK